MASSSHKIIRALIQQDYILPMADAERTEVNGWTPEQVREHWFLRHDINSYHASREAHALGNGRRLVACRVMDGAPAPGDLDLVTEVVMFLVYLEDEVGGSYMMGGRRLDEVLNSACALFGIQPETLRKSVARGPLGS